MTPGNPGGPHSVINGRTRTGKTQLAKLIASGLRRNGRRVIVYDVEKSVWDADFLTDNQEDFLDEFWSSTAVTGFIDEGGETARRGNIDMIRVLTRGAKHGNQVFLISQRFAQMDLTLRSQGSHLYLFQSTFDDCKALEKEFTGPGDLEEARRFPPGHFLYCNGVNPPVKYILDFAGKKIMGPVK